VDAVTAPKNQAARRRTAKPKPVECPTCKGSGEVSRTVRVGRKQRAVGQQTGLCLACLGSGHAATD
jgi:DnaJ-class molecular chaperone